MNLKKYSNSNYKLVFIAVGLLISSVLIACYKVPVTGRNQLILISEWRERQIGLVAFRQLIAREKISKNYRYNSSVKRVGSRIARVSHAPNLRWRYVVIENDNMVNAFALPGGKVGVYTGIIKLAQTEAQLATVMSHEIAHAIARHGAERMTVGILAQVGASGVASALKKKDPVFINVALSAYGVAATVGAILPFSRKQEAEADRIGLIYMAKAGYDPREAIKFWEKMGRVSKGQPSEFFSTHPNYGTRIENLKEWLPEAMEIYNKVPKAPDSVI